MYNISWYNIIIILLFCQVIDVNSVLVAKNFFNFNIFHNTFFCILQKNITINF